jgi:GNAT superfamily N-acetyltransferase
MHVYDKNTNPGFAVLFRENGIERGRVNLRHLGKQIFETHSSLEPRYRGQGYGIRMYERAILYCLAHGMKIRSSTNPSTFAERVWKSKRLRAKFQIVRRRYRYVVLGLK